MRTVVFRLHYMKTVLISLHYMNVNKICTACDINIDSGFYLKDRTVCKSCYNMKRRKNNNDAFIQNQQIKIDNVDTNNNNPTVILGFSKCGTSVLRNINLLR